MDWARKVAAAIMLGALAASVALAAGSHEEYDVKAAFLLNFVRFVEWPEAAARGPKAPIVLCNYGEDPFDGTLAAVVRGKTVGGHPLVVRQVSSPADAAACHVVFVPREQSRKIRDIAGSIQGRAVLVVGESADFAERGGMINFVIRDEHVRFEINPDAAGAAGLKISSKLLQLATIVRGR